MGMAASQARYLQLTARKTNVEFQGQQVNQQRTELANESAGLFSQLMGLQVPTAPSTADYTTTQYKFNDGTNSCSITSINPLAGDPDFNYTVSYNYIQNIYTGIAKTRSDLGVKLVSDGGTPPAYTYWLTDGTTTTAKTKLTQCSTDPLSESYQTDKTALDQIILDTGNTTNLYTDYNNGAGIDKIYKYTSNGITNYYSKSDLDAAASKGGSATTFPGYYAAYLDKAKNVTEKAYITKTDSGRYGTIELESLSTPLNLTAATTTDSNAYNDAMNEYEYQQTRYQQEVTNINAKTSVIQQEDRALELKLKQLDTEQEALSTEMDAVKKVIDKNIEQTFKTFS